MLCTAVRGLSFFCNIYIRIYIINNNEIYKYIIKKKKKISDVYVHYVKVYCRCDFKSHTDNILLHNKHIHHLLFCLKFIYLYISLLFIIYIRMYILQKKDKPRTAMQSIGPQTKFLSMATTWQLLSCQRTNGRDCLVGNNFIQKVCK